MSVMLGLVAAVLIVAIAWAVERFARQRTFILCYHRVISDDSGAFGDPVWSVRASEFADQVRALLAAGYEPIDLDRWLEGTRRPAALPRRAVVFTFDDGYRSVLEHAIPVLDGCRAPAVVYAIVAPDAATRAYAAGHDDFLSLDDLALLHRRGHTIGSHTMTHAILRDLTPEQVAWELQGSRQALQAAIGAEVRHFCVPRAGGLAHHAQAVADAGYWTCAGNHKGGTSPHAAPLQLPRHTVPLGTSGRQLVADLAPLAQVRARLIGNAKRLLNWVLGPRKTRVLRGWLGESALRFLVLPRAQDALAVGALLAVAVGAGVWVWLR